MGRRTVLAGMADLAGDDLGAQHVGVKKPARRIPAITPAPRRRPVKAFQVEQAHHADLAIVPATADVNEDIGSLVASDRQARRDGGFQHR